MNHRGVLTVPENIPFVLETARDWSNKNVITKFDFKKIFPGIFHDFSVFFMIFRDFWKIFSVLEDFIYIFVTGSVTSVQTASGYLCEFRGWKFIFRQKNKTFLTHPATCEFSSCNSHKHKSYDDLKILRKKLTFFPDPEKYLLTWCLGVSYRCLFVPILGFHVVSELWWGQS